MTKADVIFKNNITRILQEGVFSEQARPKYKDGTVANSKYITGAFAEYDLSKGEFPITTLRPIPIKSAIKEVLSMTSTMFTIGMIGKLEILEQSVNAMVQSLRNTTSSIKSSNSWNPILGTAAISSLSGIIKPSKKQTAFCHVPFKRCLMYAG